MSEENTSEAQDTTKATEETTQASEKTATAEATTEVTKEATTTTEAKTETEKVVPEKYELKLPDDSQLDAARLEKISAYAKEKGYSNEEAQALVQREDDAVREFHEAQKAELETKIAAWKEDLANDKEFGGDKFKENSELAHRALSHFAPPDFVEALKATGMGNHPGLVKTFHKIGKAMGEDLLINPGAQGKADAQTPAEILYGGTSKS